jgi:5-oxoprolinase (ATP-hydrolysing) subunit A
LADRVDLNADVGEGIGQDPELIPLLTSVNVACGVHAGDEATMRDAVVLARSHGVAVGAHPSFPDREGFGRREMQLPADAVEASVGGQIRALAAICAFGGVRMRHVKPHGALYNMAARDQVLADAIARATAAADPSLFLVGLAGSRLIEAGRRAGLRVANEAFADRGYRADGTLVPRSEPGSVIHDAGVVAARALSMVRDGAVLAMDGTHIPLQVDTICVHGDTPGAAALAARIRDALSDAGIELRSLG